MKIVGFSEGARGEYAGIVSVPTILASAAAQGHNAVLVLGGDMPPGKEQFVVSDCSSAQTRREGLGTFGAICVKVVGSRWVFNPAILWRFRKLVKDADFVSLHSLYSFPVLAGYLLARFYGKPYGLWPHGVLAPFQRRISVRKKTVYNRLFADCILRNASVIFFSSQGERDGAADLKLRPPSVIVPDGFDADEFSSLPERGRFRSHFLNGHDGPLVLFLARLHATKGLDLLIEAMRRVVAARPEAQLAIVGPHDPPSFDKQVLEWIKQSGIEDRTVVTGNADAQVRLEAFADADLYVLPSHAESFGFSIFEAMACGVPVLVSETLNYGTELARNGAGLALARTPEAFAEAIVNLIDRPDLRREMGARGRVYARQYPIEKTGEKLAKATESILQRKAFPAEVFPRPGWSVAGTLVKME